MKTHLLSPQLFLSGIALLLTISACEWGKPGKTAPPAITRDTLKYKYTVYAQKADDCGNRKDSTCTDVSINYPEFEQQQPLNDTIQSHVANLFQLNEKMTLHSVKQLANQFMAIYKADTYAGKMAYRLHVAAKVNRQDSSLLTVELSGDIFTGGAHGGTATGFLNWNTKSGQVIKLKDLLKDNYDTTLTAVGEKVFRKQEHLADTASLREYFFAHEKFVLNQNFIITPAGLRFVYNEYEIKPYAAGQTSLLIPYSLIKNLLKPNTVIEQYHP